MDRSRRLALRHLAKGAAIATALRSTLAAGAVPVGPARAAGDADAFDARDLDSALQALGVDASAPGGAIRIDAPGMVEDGAFVVVDVDCAVPDTESLTILAERNPWPCVARFDLRAALPRVTLRLRLAETSGVRVVAHAAGHDRQATRQVTVIAGSCGNDAATDAPAVLARDVATRPIRIRAIAADGVTRVRALMTHPMENGLRRNAAGRTFGEHFIRRVVAQANGRTVFEAWFGRSVSTDPLLGFSYPGGQAGDRLELRWIDSLGLSRADAVAVIAA